MKINKFNKIYENITNEYYEVRQIMRNGEYLVIPPSENYEYNYDEYDLDEIINFVNGVKDDYKPNKLKIYKITVEELDDSIISSRKYNL
jgi:hypothetical protein